jgi:hypothetical protein
MDSKGNEKHVLDFDAWAAAWNQDVQTAEECARAGKLEVQASELAVLRKRASDLKEYWRTSQADDNMWRTAEKHWPVLKHLRATMRTADLLAQPEQDNAIAEDFASLTVAPAGAAATTHVLAAGGTVAFAPVMQAPQSAAASVAAAAPSAPQGVPAYVPPLSQASAVYAQLGGPQFGQQPVAMQLCNPQPGPAVHKAPAKGARAPNVCQTCGHLRRLGHYGAIHNSRTESGTTLAAKQGCAVPRDEWRPASTRIIIRRKRVFPVCTCVHCEAAAPADSAKRQRLDGPLAGGAGGGGAGGGGSAEEHRDGSAGATAAAEHESAGAAAEHESVEAPAEHESVEAAAEHEEAAAEQAAAEHESV